METEKKFSSLVFQAFHWYVTSDENLWRKIESDAARYSQLGIEFVWLPPAYKSAWGLNEPGYAAYDLYDLGEFDQKGTVRTRWGTKEEYCNAIKALQKNNVQALADVVLNHKIGADENELASLIRVNPENRTEWLEECTIEVPTKYNFPGRKQQYSSFVWDRQCFTGIRYEENIYLIQNEYTGEGWKKVLDDQHGNFDFLMGADIEFRNPFVREELLRWAEWYIQETGIDGFRLDGLKHMPTDFFPAWLNSVNTKFNKQFPSIGEYWKSDVADLSLYIEATERKIKLFDVPLHSNLREASVRKADYDLRTIFDNTLLQVDSEMAVTFVDNHDSQPLQALESPVEDWFRPAAYALILLRPNGIPCLFYPDLYGDKYIGEDEAGTEKEITMHAVPFIEVMLTIRKHFENIVVTDYFNDSNCIGWVLTGAGPQVGQACIIIISNRDENELHVSLGDTLADGIFNDATGSFTNTLQANNKGECVFGVKAGAIAIWKNF